MENCVFCAKTDVPYQFQDFKVFQTLEPTSEIHYLIVPKTHMVSILTSKEHWDKLFYVVESLKKILNVSSYSLHVNNYPPRQVVPHAHVHFLAETHVRGGSH